MTSSTAIERARKPAGPEFACAPAPIHRRRRCAFTLVEMLVVIGIIIILISILVPMAIYANKSAVRTRMQADLQTIGNALEAYKEDFKDYPRIGYMPSSPGTTSAPSGAVLLCWALVAPGPATQDGVDGPGFAIRTGAQAHQSYLALSSFRIGLSVDAMPKPPPATPLPVSDYTATINDRYDHPILYFAATPNASSSVSYVADVTAPPSNGAMGPVLNHADNKYLFAYGSSASLPLLPLSHMQVVMGDTNFNGKIDGNENAVFNGLPYLLWGAGPDEQYGLVRTGLGACKCDDVTNATVQEWSGPVPPGINPPPP